MRALLSAAALLIAATASAQKPKTPPATQQKSTTPAAASSAPAKQAGAPATPAAPPKDPTSIAIYPLGSGAANGRPQGQAPDASLNVSVASRVANGFEGSNQWKVLNRADDQGVISEFSKTFDKDHMGSDVSVEDSKKLNARYVMTGRLDQVDQTPGNTKNGCTTFQVNFHFTVIIRDVETDATFASQTFIAGWPSANSQTIREVGTLQAAKPVTQAVTGAMNKLLGRKNSGPACKSDTQAESIEYSLIDVKNQVADWATSTAAQRK
jgi:hypothetical protein